MTKIVLALLSGMAVVYCSAACAKVQPGINAARSKQPSRSHAAPQKAQQQLPTPLWQQYLHAGIDFEKRGDLTKAKQYYLYALTLLEQTKPTTNRLTSGLAHLESHILKIYRAPRSAAKGTAKIQQDEEEIAVLARLEQLNQIYKDRGDRLGQTVQAREKIVAADLERNKGSFKPQ